jgi:predicted ester cyclase
MAAQPDRKELIILANQELIEKGNLGVIQDYFVPEYITLAGNKTYSGYGFIEKWCTQLRKAMPNIRVKAIDFYLEDNNTLVWQRTLSGKHITKMWGVVPSEKTITWNEMIVTRFEQYKIREEWVVSELKGELLSKPPAKS